MLPSHVPDKCEICNISVLRLYNILCVKEMCRLLYTWVCLRYGREWEGCGGALREQEVN